MSGPAPKNAREMSAAEFTAAKAAIRRDEAIRNLRRQDAADMTKIRTRPAHTKPKDATP